MGMARRRGNTITFAGEVFFYSHFMIIFSYSCLGNGMGVPQGAGSGCPVKNQTKNNKKQCFFTVFKHKSLNFQPFFWLRTQNECILVYILCEICFRMINSTKTCKKNPKTPNFAIYRFPQPTLFPIHARKCQGYLQTLWDPWGLFFIHLTHESKISDHKGMNSVWDEISYPFFSA